MKTFTKVFMVVLATAMLASCGGKDEDKKALLDNLKKEQAELSAKIAKLEEEIAKSDTTAKKNGVLVSVMPVQKEMFSHYLDIQGKIESDNNILVSAQMGGKLTKVYVKEGDYVKRGQLLAQIDAEQIEKGIAELKTSMELVNTIYEKQKALWDEKIGTEVQFLQAKNNKESLDKKLLTLQTQLSYSRITATQDGVVDKLINREGESVAPGPVFRIVNNNAGLKVTAEVAETYSSKVSKGDEIAVLFEDLNKTQNTRITNVGEIINPMSRTFTIESKLNGNPGGVKPNMIVKIKVRDYQNKNAVVIPVNTIQTGLEGQFVYVTEGTKAVRRTIKLGNTYGNKAEVVDGLVEGDKVITVGYLDLVNGQEISVK